MNETRQLAEFVHDTSYTDLPPEVIESCRVFLLDNLASALVGARTPWAKMVRELAGENGGSGSCSILGTGETASASYAALANGTAIAGFETDQAFYPQPRRFPPLCVLNPPERFGVRKSKFELS